MKLGPQQGAFSVIVQLVVEPMDRFAALMVIVMVTSDRMIMVFCVRVAVWRRAAQAPSLWT